MIRKEIIKKVKQIQSIGLDDFIKDYNIELSYSNTLHEQACLVVCRHQVEILLRDDLEEQRMRFAILHELGHYMLDVEDGTYAFFAGYHLSKSEFHANLFACLYILSEAEDSDINVISYLIQHGCPKEVAVHVFDYLNMQIQLSANTHSVCSIDN